MLIPFLIGLVGLGTLLGYTYTARRAFQQLLAQNVAAVKAEAEAAYARLPADQAAKGDMAPINESEEEADTGDSGVQNMDELPECVQHYFAHAIRDNRRFRTFTLTQELHLRFKQPDGPWIKAPGTNVASPLTPAFAFTGTARMNPAMWVQGYEALLGGKGRMQWRAWGAVPVASNEGPLIDKAARIRWMSEAIAYPQGLLPSSFLRWDPVPGAPNQATATLTWGGTTVRGTFTFDSRHNIVRFYSPDYSQQATVGGATACGIVGTCRSHMVYGLSPQVSQWGRQRAGTAGGVVVPAEMEAAFVDGEGRETPYVRVLLHHIEAR